MASIMERCPCAGSNIAADRAEEAVEAALAMQRAALEARDVAGEALRYAREAEKIRDLTTSAAALETDEAPTAVYSRAANHLAFGLPRGKTGPIGPPPTILEAADISELPPEDDKVIHLVGDTLWQWIDGAWRPGARLPKGPRGDPFQITGGLEKAEDLPPCGDTGDAYLIGGNLWVWNGTARKWTDAGPLTPHIGENGNWWTGSVDTGVVADFHGVIDCGGLEDDADDAGGRVVDCGTVE